MAVIHQTTVQPAKLELLASYSNTLPQVTELCERVRGPEREPEPAGEPF
jgi:hypothetical protein